MTTPVQRPDPQRVLRGLKDFQRATVEYVFRRMYLDTDATRRFLVADEVGLGKTLVARGLTARAIDYLWDTTDRIDVVYICSNGDIARQNIRRLNVTGQEDYAIASRITLLPLEVSDLRANKLNFLSLTPSTSFDLRSATGITGERALLYHMLAEHWSLTGKGAINVFQVGADPQRFRELVRDFDPDEIDPALWQSFLARVDERATADRAAGAADLRSRFDGCIEVFDRSNARTTIEERRERDAIIGDLRALLASACLRALEPDLIILDEFQRFKHLLSPDDPGAVFARELFDYEEHQSKARVVLLSATPYKMYTTHDDPAEVHYADFLQTLEFLLHNDTSRVAECEVWIAAYRDALERGDADQERGREAVRALEQALRKVMVRTERLAQTSDRNGMLVVVPSEVELATEDVASFVRLQQVADQVGEVSALEFWKSAPYLLAFMEDYKLKRSVSEAMGEPDGSARLASCLGAGEGILLPVADLGRYGRIPEANARLRWLRSKTLDRGMWQLLWMPPSLPYYGLEGSYGGADRASLTKHLVFSSWNVVPRAVASMLSYEAERLMTLSHEPGARNSPDARAARRPLLRFTYSEDRLGGLALWLLLYPSTVLAEAGDLLRGGSGAPVSLEESLAGVRSKIASLLAPIQHRDDGVEDEMWYWLAPVLLDVHHVGESAAKWIRYGLSTKLLEDEAEDEEGAAELSLLQRAIDFLQLKGWTARLGRPPADLEQVLALTAVAGPGVAALRALGRLTGQKSVVGERQSEAFRLAWALRNLFNQPEVMSLIRGMNAAEPYWKRVLEHCAAGCLSAVLDEYAHVLLESEGILEGDPAEAVAQVGARMREALGLRTANIAVDPLSCDGVTLRREADLRMRLRFAVRFGDERTEDGTQRSRAAAVRNAFNSPFWPFVLVTTSIGQEGLDFHQYAHAVVHWNVPSNPVDFEQREGRVHRYKGHAVRKNVATAGGLAVALGDDDPWQRLFAHAVSSRPAAASDIVPFWVYPIPNGARIERHVPMLLLSRDVVRLERLRTSLTLYRLVFGQPRQEDLLAHLMKQHAVDRTEAFLQSLRIDLSPPAAPAGGHGAWA